MNSTTVTEDLSLADASKQSRAAAIVIGADDHDPAFFTTLCKLKQDTVDLNIPVLVLVDSIKDETWAVRALESGADDLIEAWTPSCAFGRRVAGLAALHRQGHLAQLAEQGYLPLSESLPAVVYVRQHQAPYRHLYVSPNADTLGHPRDDWYRNPEFWVQSIHPRDLDRVLDAAKRGSTVGGDQEIEYRIIGDDGTVFWVNDRGRFVCEPDGKVASWRGVMIDVSQRRRAEEALRQSEERYRAVVDQSVVGIYLLDVETKKIIEANPAFCGLLGYPAEEVRTLTLDDLAGESEEEIARSLSRAIANQREYVGERQYRRKDGSLIDLDVFSNLVRYGDREVFCVTCNDISERKSMENALRRSEADFRSLIENALDIITIVDANGVIRFQSPSVERLLGYRADDMIARNAFDFIYPDDVAPTLAALRRAIAEPGATESSEFRFRHKDGSWRVLEAVGKTPPANTGIAGVVINSRDVTERKQLQQQLVRSEKLAAMGHLVSGVAHELNNPLTSVIGFTQLMMTSDGADPKSLERLDIIRSQAERARKIVQNLLSFSRQKKPEKVEVRLNDLLEKVLELRGYHLEVNNIRVVREFGELSAVFADGAQLEQVFLNIIINAEQAILGVRRGGTISIKTSLGHADGHTRARVAIADDGPGISPDFLGRIFDPFFTTKEVGQGTGLGLSISYGIIKEHGGMLEVTSHQGSGTTFLIELPAAG